MTALDNLQTAKQTIDKSVTVAGKIELSELRDATAIARNAYKTELANAVRELKDAKSKMKPEDYNKWLGVLRNEIRDMKEAKNIYEQGKRLTSRQTIEKTDVLKVNLEEFFATVDETNTQMNEIEKEVRKEQKEMTATFKGLRFDALKIFTLSNNTNQKFIQQWLQKDFSIEFDANNKPLPNQHIQLDDCGMIQKTNDAYLISGAAFDNDGRNKDYNSLLNFTFPVKDTQGVAIDYKKMSDEKKLVNDDIVIASLMQNIEKAAIKKQGLVETGSQKHGVVEVEKLKTDEDKLFAYLCDFDDDGKIGERKNLWTKLGFTDGKKDFHNRISGPQVFSALKTLEQKDKATLLVNIKYVAGLGGLTITGTSAKEILTEMKKPEAKKKFIAQLSMFSYMGVDPYQVLASGSKGIEKSLNQRQAVLEGMKGEFDTKFESEWKKQIDALGMSPEEKQKFIANKEVIKSQLRLEAINLVHSDIPGNHGSGLSLGLSYDKLNFQLGGMRNQETGKMAWGAGVGFDLGSGVTTGVFVGLDVSSPKIPAGVYIAKNFSYTMGKTFEGSTTGSLTYVGIGTVAALDQTVSKNFGGKTHEKILSEKAEYEQTVLTFCNGLTSKMDTKDVVAKLTENSTKIDKTVPQTQKKAFISEIGKFLESINYSSLSTEVKQGFIDRLSSALIQRWYDRELVEQNGSVKVSVGMTAGVLFGAGFLPIPFYFPHAGFQKNKVDFTTTSTSLQEHAFQLKHNKEGVKVQNMAEVLANLRTLPDVTVTEKDGIITLTGNGDKSILESTNVYIKSDKKSEIKFEGANKLIIGNVGPMNVDVRYDSRSKTANLILGSLNIAEDVKKIENTNEFANNTPKKLEIKKVTLGTRILGTPTIIPEAAILFDIHKNILTKEDIPEVGIAQRHPKEFGAFNTDYKNSTASGDYTKARESLNKLLTIEHKKIIPANADQNVLANIIAQYKDAFAMDYITKDRSLPTSEKKIKALEYISALEVSNSTKLIQLANDLIDGNGDWKKSKPTFLRLFKDGAGSDHTKPARKLYNLLMSNEELANENYLGQRGANRKEAMKKFMPELMETRDTLIQKNGTKSGWEVSDPQTGLFAFTASYKIDNKGRSLGKQWDAMPPGTARIAGGDKAFEIVSKSESGKIIEMAQGQKTIWNNMMNSIKGLGVSNIDEFVNTIKRGEDYVFVDKGGKTTTIKAECISFMYGQCFNESVGLRFKISSKKDNYDVTPPTETYLTMSANGSMTTAEGKYNKGVAVGAIYARGGEKQPEKPKSDGGGVWTSPDGDVIKVDANGNVLSSTGPNAVPVGTNISQLHLVDEFGNPVSLTFKPNPVPVAPVVDLRRNTVIATDLLAKKTGK